jgi:hypothetical protein
MPPPTHAQIRTAALDNALFARMLRAVHIFGNQQGQVPGGHPLAQSYEINTFPATNFVAGHSTLLLAEEAVRVRLCFMDLSILRDLVTTLPPPRLCSQVTENKAAGEYEKVKSVKVKKLQVQIEEEYETKGYGATAGGAASISRGMLPRNSDKVNSTSIIILGRTPRRRVPKWQEKIQTRNYIGCGIRVVKIQPTLSICQANGNRIVLVYHREISVAIAIEIAGNDRQGFGASAWVGRGCRKTCAHALGAPMKVRKVRARVSTALR